MSGDVQPGMFSILEIIKPVFPPPHFHQRRKILQPGIPDFIVRIRNCGFIIDARLCTF